MKAIKRTEGIEIYLSESDTGALPLVDDYKVLRTGTKAFVVDGDSKVVKYKDEFDPEHHHIDVSFKDNDEPEIHFVKDFASNKAIQELDECGENCEECGECGGTGTAKESLGSMLPQVGLDGRPAYGGNGTSEECGANCEEGAIGDKIDTLKEKIRAKNNAQHIGLLKARINLGSKRKSKFYQDQVTAWQGELDARQKMQDDYNKKFQESFDMESLYDIERYESGAYDDVMEHCTDDMSDVDVCAYNEATIRSYWMEGSDCDSDDEDESSVVSTMQCKVDDITDKVNDTSEVAIKAAKNRLENIIKKVKEEEKKLKKATKNLKDKTSGSTEELVQKKRLAEKNLSNWEKEFDKQYDDMKKDIKKGLKKSDKVINKVGKEFKKDIKKGAKEVKKTSKNMSKEAKKDLKKAEKTLTKGVDKGTNYFKSRVNDFKSFMKESAVDFEAAKASLEDYPFERRMDYYEAVVALEAANIEEEIKPIVEMLNSKGYKVKYSSPGHIKLRKKEDGDRDGVYYGKLYSDARIMLQSDYKLPAPPKGWKMRQVDKCDYLDVVPKTYNQKDGSPNEAFKKWKNEYMTSLKEWVKALPHAGDSSVSSGEDDSNEDKVPKLEYPEKGRRDPDDRRKLKPGVKPEKDKDVKESFEDDSKTSELSTESVQDEYNLMDDFIDYDFTNESLDPELTIMVGTYAALAVATAVTLIAFAIKDKKDFNRFMKSYEFKHRKDGIIPIKDLTRKVYKKNKYGGEKLSQIHIFKNARNHTIEEFYDEAGNLQFAIAYDRDMIKTGSADGYGSNGNTAYATFYDEKVSVKIMFQNKKLKKFENYYIINVLRKHGAATKESTEWLNKEMLEGKYKASELSTESVQDEYNLMDDLIAEMSLSDFE